MTREEIIECLKTLKKSINETVGNKLQGEFTYIANVRPDSAEFVIQSAIKALEQEHCEDAISRQMVLDYLFRPYSNEELYSNIDIAKLIKELPSVIPKRTNVLDKIKAEIEKMPTDYCGGYIGLDKKDVLQVIDKYKVESKV